MSEKVKQAIASEAGRVDRIVQQLTGLSRSKVRGLFDHGRVFVNNKVCESDFARVASGDRVEVRHDPHRGYREKEAAWKDPAFSIVYEDEHLIVVEKAAAALTVPTGPAAPKAKTLVERVSRYLSRQGRNKRAHLVHRLDRGVSGLMVFAKSGAIAGRLKEQFASHKPMRQYVAMVAGRMKEDRGTFRSHLATADNLDRYSVQDERDGELAVTHFEVEQRLKDVTVVRCRLETGRRNQIRVHFAEAGHPVLGDPRYRPELAAHACWPHKRIALHAQVLGLIHPMTGKSLKWESELPGEFQQAVKALSKRD